jgi:hypothetical protein
VPRAADRSLYGQNGPAGGYCTRACDPTDPENPVCGVANGYCVDFSAAGATTTQGYCVQACSYGGEDRVSKCWGRQDVACVRGEDQSANVIGACFPICSSDRQCPTGRRCDSATGTCIDTPTAGDPLGAYCVPPNPDGGAATDTCAGSCLRLGAGTICTRYCVLGELNGCEWVGAGMSLAGGNHGVCLLGRSDARAGDLGFCAQQCDSVADCANKTDPGVMCDTTTVPIDIAGHGACIL